MQRKYLKLVLILAGMLIILGGIIGYFTNQRTAQEPVGNPTNEYGQPDESADDVSDDFGEESAQSPTTFVLKHPITQYKNPTNKLSGVNISGYRREPHELGSEFVFSVRGAPDDFGQAIDAEVPDLKVRASEISNFKIILENLGEVGGSGLGNPFIDDASDIVIKDDVCVPIRPTALDVAYSYCFEIDTENGIPVVSYSVVSQSTMPTP